MSVETPDNSEISDLPGSGEFQVANPLTEEQYESLKSDIKENGVEVAVVVDENGVPIDGHHRIMICDELGIEDYPTDVRIGLSHIEKRALARRLNADRRQMDSQAKRDLIEQALTEYAKHGDYPGDEKVAQECGATRQWVGEVRREISEGGEKETNFDFTTQSKKRETIRKELEENPDQSNRAIGREVNADKNTVGKVRKEIEEESNTPQVSIQTQSESEREKVAEMTEAADGGSEEAFEQLKRVEQGDITLEKASKKVKDAGGGDDDIELFTSQETDEWSSPREVVEPISEAIGGFTLDPCSGAEQSPFADETYTEDDDGLSQSWHGDVWVNPPYSDMKTWTEKAIEESQRDEVGLIVYLCKGDTSTEWWHSAIVESEVVCAIDRRLSFGDGENSAPFASHIFVFGGLMEGLSDSLDEQGVLLTEYSVGDEK